MLTGATMSGVFSMSSTIPKILPNIVLPDIVYAQLKNTLNYTFDQTPDIFSFIPKI
jgi:hypothetical protein